VFGPKWPEKVAAAKVLPRAEAVQSLRAPLASTRGLTTNLCSLSEHLTLELRDERRVCPVRKVRCSIAVDVNRPANPEWKARSCGESESVFRAGRHATILLNDDQGSGTRLPLYSR
jgi:hypothetical protein